MSWQCNSCGFMNRPGNQVCGGTGTMGCKAPKEASVGGGFAPAKRGRFTETPYGIPSSPSAVVGVGPGPWQCVSCNFTNKEMNQVCGGTGRMGCKSPRALSDASAAISGMADLAGMADMSGFGMAAAGGASSGGAWQCPLCAFVNKPQNAVCGGERGKLGCKNPRELVDIAALMGGIEATPPPRPSSRMSSPMATPRRQTSVRGPVIADSEAWACPECNFKNRASNDVCGGMGGTLGCKAPRPANDAAGFDAAALSHGMTPDMMAMLEMAAMAQLTGGAMPMEAAVPRQSSFSGGGLSESSGWACSICNFKNRPGNDVCGGRGNLGCKTPREEASGGALMEAKRPSPMSGGGGRVKGLRGEVRGVGGFGKGGGKGAADGPEWVCMCGFTNKSRNAVCGGTGPMGCKLAKEDAVDQLLYGN
eukprot:TRINITY_DN24358_c0_g1_i1.p1 TRINITY_DN24358_c0_g1~~TRINITY_DN24358_c0_g1_i1.p1  ORF type:complete len:443 (+),score=73.23 TRINITY_DN24358_c0_g1_i1:70-1329(+)